MSYAPPPPPPGQGPPPPPPGAGMPPPPPPGYGPPVGQSYYGPPQAPGAPAPHQARTSGGKLLGGFLGVLIGVGVLVGIIVLANQPPPPISCPEGELCNPDPPASVQPDRTQPPGPNGTPLVTLPPFQTPQPTPVGQTPDPAATPVPTPISNAPPFVGGTVWRSASLGYSFEYDAGLWDLEREDDTFALLAINGNLRVRDQQGNVEVRPLRIELIINGFPGSTTPQAAMQSVLAQTDTSLIGRAPNNRNYDALLGAGIGYVRGEGGVFSATLKNADGTPGRPVGITMMASTNGRITLVAQVIVHDPDVVLGGNTLQKEGKGLADRVTKTVLWDAQ